MSGHERADEEVASRAQAAPPPVDWADRETPADREIAGDLESDGAEGDGAPEGEAPEPADPLTEQRELAGKYLDLAQRTQADFDNYRKRMAREVRAAEARGIGKLAREMLPALDNLERALAAADASDPEHDLSQGIRLVAAELSAALGRAGITGYDPTGEVFDPAHHEAVAQQPIEGTDAGIVVQVLQSGYRLNDAILRPARVIVAS